MNRFMKGMTLSIVLSASAHAAKVNEDSRHIKVPHVKEVSFEDPIYLKEKKEWTKQKRKLASDMSFSNSDLSPDLQKLREEWLAVKNGVELEALLKKSVTHYQSYSQDTKYFLAQLHVALPLRGIIWRLVPLFENQKGFLGNKSTHVTAIQAVRQTISALKMLLPTKQTDAAVQFFTEPSEEMSKADQFHSVAQFQKFMMEGFLPVLNESITKIEEITRDGSGKVFVWDNKMIFGRGTFEDDIQRFTGNGPAEMNFVLATMYRAYHNVLLYCAFDQNYAIKLAGQMGTHLGIDSSVLTSKREDLGLTDIERVKLVRNAAAKHQFLELRNLQAMLEAYKALKNSVVYAERSYDYLQTGDSSHTMALNPVLFQQDLVPNLAKGLQNMKAVVSGPAEVRDPVTGDTVTINLRAFYQNPPRNLSVLLPVDFEGGEIRKTIKNKKGESLIVRNYLHGRSVAWDNSVWKLYVPSASGKAPGYMMEARRIIKYSFGTSMVFGLPDFFVH